MLITHAQNRKGNKSETPKRKINHIASNKQNLNVNFLQPKQSNWNINDMNKQNQHPNKMSAYTQNQLKPENKSQKPKVRESRVKSQYYTNQNGASQTVKQSPVKKIVFVKSLCHKSNKTSLEKKQIVTTNLFKNNYMQSHNQVKETPIQQKLNLKQNQNVKYKHSFSEDIINNQQDQKVINRVNSFKYPASSHLSISRNRKMCPKIQSCQLLAEINPFGKKNQKTGLRTQQNKQENKNMQNYMKNSKQQKKQSFSMKKRHSRVKITLKDSQKHKKQIEQTPNEEQFKVIENIKKNFSGKKSESIEKLNQSHSISSGQKLQRTLDDSKALKQGSLSKSQSQFIFSPSLRQQSPINKRTPQKCLQKICCYNHSEKQAKFKLNLQEGKQYYCSKCTVNLVTQGYTVIQNLQIKPNRLQILKNFLFEADKFEPIVKNISQSLSFVNDQLINKYHLTQNQIKDYYGQLHKQLKTDEESTLKGIKCYFQSTQERVIKIKRQIQEYGCQLAFMRSDIIPNIDMIVDEEKLIESNFKQIMEEHENKLNSFKQSIQYILTDFDNRNQQISFKSIQSLDDQLQMAIKYIQNTQIQFQENHFPFREILKTRQIKKNKELFSTAKKQFDETKRSFSFEQYGVQDSLSQSSKKKKNYQTSKNYNLDESIRLSFGKQIEVSDKKQIKSPTFKVI